MLGRSLGVGLAVAMLVMTACGGGAATPSTAPASSAPTMALPTGTPPTAATAAPTVGAEYTVVAIGDSIPYNSEDDCSGCTGFVDFFATELGKAAGRTVAVINNSEHNNNTVELLLEGLTQQQSRIDAVAGADAVIVGIAHNDVPMNRDDDACDGPASESPDWSKFTSACIATEVARFTPIYEALYARVAELRAGKPTILRTINRYNDWNGWPGHELSPEGLDATVRVIAAWNDMICSAAEKSGFVCADISTAFNGEDGRKASGDLLAGDYTHPSQKGNDLIGQLLLDPNLLPLFQ